MKKRLFARYGLLVAMIAASGGLLLQTSQSVQRAEAEMRGLEKSIERERQTIEVLQAEWAYLNSPYRLEKLVQKYLGMVPSEVSYIVPDAGMLPDEDVVVSGEIENAVAKGDVPVGAEAGGSSAAAKVPLQHVSAAPVQSAAKPAPPRDVRKSVNGDAEAAGFDDLMNRLGRGQ